MKTTLDLPEDLVRALKLRAVHENRRIKDVATEVLRRGLAAGEPGIAAASTRVRLPLIAGGERADPGEEITPERAAGILLAADVDAVSLGSA